MRRFWRVFFHQEESATLDFKVQQYSFVSGTPEQKGELLKDILAFANSWRQTDAYILIGVKEVRGGRSLVPGIPPSHHRLSQPAAVRLQPGMACALFLRPVRL